MVLLSGRGRGSIGWRNNTPEMPGEEEKLRKVGSHTPGRNGSTGARATSGDSLHLLCKIRGERSAKPVGKTLLTTGPHTRAIQGYARADYPG
jgi:hypothetical protein